MVKKSVFRFFNVFNLHTWNSPVFNVKSGFDGALILVIIMGWQKNIFKTPAGLHFFTICLSNKVYESLCQQM